jgi:hypothetical protein
VLNARIFICVERRDIYIESKPILTILNGIFIGFSQPHRQMREYDFNTKLARPGT